jgi:GTP cyclohydrolase IA
MSNTGNSNGRDADTDPRTANGKTPDPKRTTTTLRLSDDSNGTIVSGSDILAFGDLDEYPSPVSEVYEQTEVLTGDMQQFEKIERAIHDLLDAFNVNWDDPNYTDTPQRVAKAYMEYWASGYGIQPEDEVTVFPNSSGTGDLVMVKDMKYYSLCSHHLAPFHGYGAIAYLPGKNLLGLSKLGRILNVYARRFQLQERISAQTADSLMSLLEPQGVIVILYDTEHMCMSSRGVQLHESNTTTIAARGVFKDDAQLRSEVFAMLRR